MEKKLAGLAFWLKFQGLPDFTKDFWVRQGMKGYRRAKPGRDSRRPVSFQLLGQLVGCLNNVCSTGYEAVLFRAAFALAFFGAFRISELVSPSKREKGGLGESDVRCGEDRLAILIRKSKTDQRGKGKTVQVFAFPGSPLCPVKLVSEFIAIRPGGGEVPFLRHQDGSFLSRFQFNAIFKRCLGVLGLEGEKFSSHSFRIGAATEAVRWGLDDAAVKRIGRWESRRFRSYVRPQLVIG
ncbi:uncharacterized protein [Aquarana catesbeiana]|uniref:uncharacterized protein n=1 Tax=Aquarana catesbeiana TaxID=8400 RepID=UPI003CC934A0